MNILGVDIGTTSIKLAIYDSKNDLISDTITKDTNSKVSTSNVHFHEQDVEKILTTFNEILDEIDNDLLQSVSHVGISGQMHGVMFWNDVKDSVCNHSNFITWMDQRCIDNNFIDSLSKMPSNIVQEMPISTGYGCASILHLMEYSPEFLEQWKYAGNIVDFFTFIFTKSDRPMMCPQMAHSWGFFDVVKSQWFIETLEKMNFPVRFLPKIVPTGTPVGQCVGVKKIPNNAVVYVGMGDLQCSMYGALKSNLNAAINISTSAQFAVRVTLTDLRKLSDSSEKILKLPPGLVVNPNFDEGDYLLVAASLNGGNVLESFVSMLQQWTFEISGIETSKEKIWTHLISTYQSKVNEMGDVRSITFNDTLLIYPTLFGERHCPNTGAMISDIFPFNCHLGDIYNSICLGLVRNLTNLLPLEIVSKLRVNHLMCSGGAIRRNQCLKDGIYKTYGPAIRMIEVSSQYDACVGAIEYLNKIKK